MRRVRVALLGMALPATLAVGVVAALPPGGVDREGLRREREITNLLNRAIGSVERADRGCRLPNPFKRETTFTDDPPTDELLQTLGVLRRPQSPEEAQLSPDAYLHLPAEGVYRKYVRIARSTSGRWYLVVAARNTNVYEPRPRRCAEALREGFGELIRDRSPRFRREARRVLEGVIRREWRAPDRGPREGVFLFDYRPDGGPRGGGGGTGVSFIRRHGMFGSAGATGQPTIVSGLVPDGVATLTAVFAREVSRGRYRPPKRYPRAVRRTVTVQDNVVSFTVPRPAPHAFPTRMIWRDADGRVVRVVRERSR